MIIYISATIRNIGFSFWTRCFSELKNNIIISSFYRWFLIFFLIRIKFSFPVEKRKMKYDFYVLCNFSYCLHHSFLTGLWGIVSGSCGCPKIRTVLKPPSRRSVPSWEIMEKTNIKTPDVQCVSMSVCLCLDSWIWQLWQCQLVIDLHYYKQAWKYDPATESSLGF